MIWDLSGELGLFLDLEGNLSIAFSLPHTSAGSLGKGCLSKMTEGGEEHVLLVS